MMYLIKGDYVSVSVSDIMEAIPEQITAGELRFMHESIIPFSGDTGKLWRLKHGIDVKICDALESGVLTGQKMGTQSESSKIMLISDEMHGIQSQLDGKVYDSKSEYYKSLKNAGHMVVEPGMIKEKKEVAGNFDCRKELKEAAQRAGLIG